MMKLKIFISLIVFLNCFLFAQQNTFDKEVELQRFIERGGKVEEKELNIYKLTYPDGNSRVYNLNHKESVVYDLDSVETTIINVWEIDTTLYADKFTFWQKVEIANSWWAALPIEDLNKNKRTELYGYTDVPDMPYPSGGPVRIFERDIDGIYKDVFEYDSSTIFVKALGDIHGTGGKEIYIHSKLVNNGVVYRSDSVGALPTSFDFTFYYEPNQINDMTFGDFDGNKITDCVFVDGSNPSRVVIGEFRHNINNFISVYEKETVYETPTGFAIGDFDKDGNTNLVFSTSEKNIYVIENSGINIYELVYQCLFSIFNPYMITVTQDLDKNEKLEFWIGGQDFEQGISRFQCYEADGDNSYKVVAVIELRYLVSLYTNYIQANDIDGDGKEELVISIGNTVLVLKFVGKINEHKYELYYAKLNEATQPGAEFYPVAVADLDGDGKKDILLPFRKYEYPITYAFSYILKNNGTSGIKSYQTDNKTSDDYIINYPTPFNASSTIRFAVSKVDFIEIKVYDSIGKEITTLLEKELSPGEYNIYWDARDKYGNLLPSGIYFISLQSEKFVKTIKTVLLK